MAILQRAYDEGFRQGEIVAWAGNYIPYSVLSLAESDDPEDYGYGNGYIDGWNVAYVEVSAQEPAPTTSAIPATTTTTPPTTTTDPPPPPAPAPAPSAPPVVDRGYEQGKADGELVGNADGRVHSWNANLYVVGQGPEYTRGFHEAYDYWYSVASKRAAQHEANERSRGAIQGNRDTYDEAQRRAQELSDNIVQIDRN
jgi:hypothetical protein